MRALAPLTVFGGILAACLFSPLLADDNDADIIPEKRPEAAGKTCRIQDSFVVKDVPAGAKKVRAWFELPQEEALQEITDLKITAPEGYRIEKEAVEGNRFLYVEIADPKATSFEVKVEFTLKRWESVPSGEKARALSKAEKSALETKLAEFPNGETTDKIREEARKLTDGVTDPAAQARKFYDYIIDSAEYWKKDPSKWAASGKGSATYCLEKGTGNCTDFHALYQALARTVDLPTQFVMGTALKPELDGVEKFDDKKKEPSYHCWVRTYFPGRGWVYSDISYADVSPEKRDYYFDHIDDARVSFSFGRNIDLAPKQDGPKLNWFIKCYVEVDGKEHTGWTRELTYKSLK